MSLYEQIEITRDGNMFCAKLPDFDNLQESPAGFGHDELEAAADLFGHVMRDARGSIDGLTWQVSNLKSERLALQGQVAELLADKQGHLLRIGDLEDMLEGRTA